MKYLWKFITYPIMAILFFSFAIFGAVGVPFLAADYLMYKYNLPVYTIIVTLVVWMGFLFGIFAVLSEIAEDEKKLKEQNNDEPSAT
jgi:uncharacterized integral membrane protein